MKPTKKLTIQKNTLKNLTVKTKLRAGLKTTQTTQTSQDTCGCSAPNWCMSDVRLKKTIRSVD
jgi:hypothetical protein